MFELFGIFGIGIFGIICFVIAQLITMFILCKFVTSEKFMKKYTEKVTKISAEMTQKILDEMDNDII